uniref:calcium-binding protein n=1 Tax=Mariniflexile sp. TaxID=1979402 RepID=UPI004047D783
MKSSITNFNLVDAGEGLWSLKYEIQLTNNSSDGEDLSLFDLDLSQAWVPSGVVGVFTGDSDFTDIKSISWNEVTGRLGWSSTDSSPGVFVVPNSPQTVGTVTYTLTQTQKDALGKIDLTVDVVNAKRDGTAEEMEGMIFTVPIGSNDSPPILMDVPELFSRPVVTDMTVTDADGSPVSALNAQDVTDGVFITVNFSKDVQGVTSGIFANSLPVTLDSSKSTESSYVFKYMPTASDIFKEDVSISTNVSSTVKDFYDNNVDASVLPVLSLVGDTKAPETPPSFPADFAPATSQVGSTGELKISLTSLAKDGDYYEIYDGGTLIATTDAKSPATTFYAMKLEEGDYDLTAKAVDAAGNVSGSSAQADVIVDLTRPGLESIVQTTMQADGTTPLGATQAGFIVTFSENVSGVENSSFELLGLTTTSTSTVAVSNIGGSPTNASLWFVTVNGVDAAEKADLTIKVREPREIDTVELTSSAQVTADADGSALTGMSYVKVTFDGDLYVPAGTMPSMPSLMASFQLGWDPSYTVGAPAGGLSGAAFSKTDPSVVYLSTSTPLADVSNLNVSLVPSMGYGLFGARIVDGVGNLIELDPGLNDFYTLLGTEGAGFVITPETGEKGLDTIDLSALNGSVIISSESGEVIFTAAGQSTVTTVYDTAGFEGYVLTNNGVNDFIGSQLSEIVYVGDGGDNVLRAGNRLSGDEAPETDIVSYAATDTAINVNLGTNASIDVKVIRGADDDDDDLDRVVGDVVDDRISGFEGVIGSTGDDTITGSGIGNFLAGAGGDDTILGEAGDDILYGGDGADKLYGGSGRDMLIDLDGSELQGSDIVGRKSSDASEKDIFVVREGATIKNFHLSGDGTGLAGRSTSANDAIIFSISAAAFAGKGLDLTAFFDGGNPNNELLDGAGFFSYVKDHLVFNTPKEDGSGGQDLIVQFKDGAIVFEVGNVKLDGLTEMLAGAAGEQSYSAGVVQLDWLTEAFNTNQQGFNSKIDMQAVNEASGFGDSGLNFAVALEAVRAGTVRAADVNGVMAGDMSLGERIYNPGFGDERIIGGKTSDRYEFLVQTFEDAKGEPSGAAGNDTVLDIGGYDVLSFSDVALNQLVFEAVKVGREAGENSLRVSYEQTDSSGTVNDGEIIWQGHFSEGGRLAAEALEVGSGSGATVYALAAARYEYDDNGYVLGGAKITSDANYGDVEAAFDVAADVIMVGQYGSGEDADTFVFETGGDAALSKALTDRTQEAHIWNFNDGDIIDVTNYVSEFGAASAVANWTYNTSSGDNTLDSYSADIVFGASELALSLTFYGSGLTQTILDDALVTGTTT